ncbi:hypothetical protein OGAPHI_004260 [Ogataea philodendri]|uniref:Uncharacterized protein n=1 Tax=Ogataea philodendri TaxID=1378263 RepID=A0A9P8P6R8_9ASCO|nr:uncharacterized protein OGAPHI_004260 [Ogataea philodendri]KAH3666071.1 hypothetical protein OGAPHI_004260 [Ogataea philodendri]
MQVTQYDLTDLLAASFEALGRNCIVGQDLIRFGKLLELDSVWISRSGNTNTFQDTIASQLFQNKLLVKLIRCLARVRSKSSASSSGSSFNRRVRNISHHLSRRIKKILDKRVFRIGKQLNKSVAQWILVLIKPPLN